LATPSYRFYRITGIAMILMALLGYLTLADELRHIGEFLAVTAILIAGLALAAASFPNPLSRRFALEWLAVGVIVGAFVGGLIDNMYVGLAVGMIVGVVTAFFVRWIRPAIVD
jgi:uncharacterized membrane protein